MVNILGIGSAFDTPSEPPKPPPKRPAPPPPPQAHKPPPAPEKRPPPQQNSNSSSQSNRSSKSASREQRSSDTQNSDGASATANGAAVYERSGGGQGGGQGDGDGNANVQRGEQAARAGESALDLDVMADDIAPRCEEDGVFEVEVRGEKMIVGVTVKPQLTRIHLSFPADSKLGALLRKREMELRGRLERRMRRTVDVHVL